MAYDTTKVEPYGYIKNLHLIEAAYFDPRLQEQTKLTLSLLVRYADQDGCIEWFSIKSTAKRKKVTRRAIQNQIKKLIECDYLAFEKRQGKDFRNQYYLCFSNLGNFRGVTQLDDTPHVTQLGNTHVTPEVTPGDTQLGDIMKTYENIEIKKEKNTQTRECFLREVKEEVGNQSFQEIGNFSEGIILEQAKACWERWSATAKFPEGSKIDAFKGWLRTGLRDRKIKEASQEPNDINARHGEQREDFEHPLQDWHEQVRSVLGEAVFRSWIRPLYWNGESLVQAPTRFIANYVNENFVDEIKSVLGDVEVQYLPYMPQKEPIDAPKEHAGINTLPIKEGDRNAL